MISDKPFVKLFIQKSLKPNPYPLKMDCVRPGIKMEKHCIQETIKTINA